MIVYLLMWGRYEPYIVGVYSSVEKAKEEAVKEIEEYSGSYLSIEEWNIDSNKRNEGYRLVYDGKEDNPDWHMW